MGWATAKAELQAPVGVDAFGFSYRDLEGSKVTQATREDYGEPYGEGDVIGLLLHMPPGGRRMEPGESQVVRFKGQLYTMQVRRGAAGGGGGDGDSALSRLLAWHALGWCGRFHREFVTARSTHKTTPPPPVAPPRRRSRRPSPWPAAASPSPRTARCRASPLPTSWRAATTRPRRSTRATGRPRARR